MSIGMAPFGVDQMLKARGNESFKAAFERAMAIARQNGTMKIAQGVADAAARNAAMTPPSRLRGYQPEPEPEIGEDQQWDLFEGLAAKFLKKIAQEREARLAGEIVAADFYLRQITVIETVFDLATAELGFDPNDVLEQIRRGQGGVMQIVDTPFVRYLDAKRREYWASAPGEPMRPAAFREEFLLDHGDHRTAVHHNAYGARTPPARGYTEEQWAEMTFEEQRSARERQFEEDAEEQVRWEQEARAEFEARQQSPLPFRGEG